MRRREAPQRRYRPGLVRSRDGVKEGVRVIVIRVPFQKIGNTFSERERVAGKEPARAVARRVVARPVFQVAIVRATRER